MGEGNSNQIGFKLGEFSQCCFTASKSLPDRKDNGKDDRDAYQFKRHVNQDAEIN